MKSKYFVQNGELCSNTTKAGEEKKQNKIQ